MTYRDVEHRCVGCGAPLASWSVGETPCERCRRCGAIWIEPISFLAILGATPTAQHPDELMVHNDGSPRRACPHCLEPMDLVWIDFLQLDQCREHGVWLDAGELERALVSAQPDSELKRLLDRMSRPRES
ncbi:MAG TPA: zf-TFIIB domain-containing protein [Polyangia bacterium]